MVTSRYQERLARCSALMKAHGLDALLLTKPANMFYLTGDGRLCAYAIITHDGRVALGVPMTDVEDVRGLAHFDHIAGFENEVGMIHSIAHHFKEFGIEQGTVGLEFTFLTQAMMGMLTHPHAKPKEVAVKDCTHILSELRIVKDADEVERIRKAAQVADIGMRAAVEAAQPGVEETHVAAAAERAMRLAGAEGFSRTYVASGRRTNIAHGLPSRRKLETNDLVMIDLHPIVDGYSADMCRTICVGKPTPEYRAAYELFLKAQQTTIAKVKAGVSMVELEQALHGIIKDAGHGAHLFGPPIHGVGIEFEEAPLPPGHAFFHGEKAPKPLEANVVITVGNCGLYIGPWGVRVEDTVLVGAENGEVLTHYPCSLEQRREPESATDTTIGTAGRCPERASGITGENLLDRGVLFRFLVDDHVRLAGLLQQARPRPGRINYGPYAEFRAGLLRHIAMEEKILLPAARRLLGGEPLPASDKLRRDHGALAALLVPTPTPEILATIRAILNDHNQVEEGAGGVYEVCERLAAEEAEALVTEMRNLPVVELASHDDDPRVMKATLNALERAGYRLEEYG